MPLNALLVFASVSVVILIKVTIRPLQLSQTVPIIMNIAAIMSKKHESAKDIKILNSIFPKPS